MKLGALSLAAAFTAATLSAQPYDVLIRNGRVLDPRNGVDGVRDVAIVMDRIAAVAENLSGDAEVVVDASGLLVAPGLVDLHAHVFHGTEEDAAYSNGTNALPPDGFTFRSCVTTVVDAGGAGWKSFPRFREQVVERSRTRVLAMLNIVGEGMRGGPVEQNLADMDPKLTAMRAREHPDTIVGIKVAHYAGPEWAPVDRAVAAGELAELPVMVDFGGHEPPLSLSSLLLEHLRPGDILTHAFAHVDGRTPIVGPDGRLRSFVRRARERGVVFDVGHGAGSFLFGQAAPAMAQGFPPDTLSTDLHRASMNAGMKDMLNVASKLVNLGMSVEEALERATAEPARVLRRDDLGHLGVGSPADVAVLRLRHGEFGFVDVSGARREGDRLLECELTLRRGEVAWDRNGRAAASAKQSDRAGYVLTAQEGEKLRGGAITVKASPETGSHRAAMFTQVLAPDSRIPLHVHHRADEFFFVHRGEGTALLGGERVPVREGDVIFVPEGSDHAIENVSAESELELVIFVSAPGLEAMFREVDARMKSRPEPMTLEELNEIAQRHGDLYKETSRTHR